MSKPPFLSFALDEQIFFAKRLGMILRAGVPIMQGLQMLGSGARSRSANHILESLIADVSSGRPLSVGLEKFEHIFGAFSINVVRVGETSGTLHENLDYLAEELKKKKALKRKLISALVYPAIIVIATVGIAVMLTAYIFPKIIPIFKSVQAGLPLSTRVLIGVSDFLNQWGLWLCAGIFALGALWALVMHFSPRFHYLADRALLSVPLFGKLSRSYALANSLRTLGILLKSEAGVIHSFELVAASTRNYAYRRAFRRAAKRIAQGEPVSEQLRHAPHLFPPLVAQMVAVGESTGNLSDSLLFLSELYEEELNDLTKNLAAMLEPVLMIVMGLVVGFIAISIITPIYSITQHVAPR